MKFKAVIENEGGSRQVMVLHVLQAFQRLERAVERRATNNRSIATLILKLSRDSFAFCHRAGADVGSQTWSHFATDRLFKEYRIESKRGHCIDLEVPISNIMHVFQSCQASEKIQMRLANGKDGKPVLAFEFAMQGNVADHSVQQEVAVRVVQDAEAVLIVEPQLPEPQYQLELPSGARGMQQICGVLDKMRKVGALHVKVEAALERPNSFGAPVAATRAWLKLSAQAELCSVASTFSSLPLITEGKSAEPPEGPVSLLLSLRRLLEVLGAVQLISAEAHIACVLEGKALVLYALMPGNVGSLISYTPIVEE